MIGGGSSITKEFGIPEELVLKVRDQEEPMSAFSPYLAPIHDKHVIAVNAAFYIGNWIDAVFFGDGGFFTKNLVQLLEFPKIKVTNNPNWRRKYNTPHIKFLQRDHQKPMGLSTRPGCLSWNANSGGSAINLASQFGAKKIYLLGFDMKLGGPDGNRQHFHTHYNRARSGQPIDPKKLPFHRHLRCFPVIAKDAKKQGIEIINVSQDTAIKDFKCLKIEDIL